jgi:hypothetical protein
VQLLLGKLSEGAYVELQDASHNVLAHVALTTPNTKLELAQDVAYVVVKNEGGLFETVFK